MKSADRVSAVGISWQSLLPQ